MCFWVKRLHIVSVPRAGSQDFECRRGRGSGLAAPLAAAAWASSGAHRAAASRSWCPAAAASCDRCLTLAAWVTRPLFLPAFLAFEAHRK